jgi:membrane-associated protease RseP (regulator of RpoE activity)
VLFLLTVAGVFGTMLYFHESPRLGHDSLIYAGQFTGALLLILGVHELAHFVAARAHRVEASLPFFIPLPVLSPFGTMGAIIRMRTAIPTRRALLDIGASGPLAGLCVAIPLYAWGVAHSTVIPLSGDYEQLGSSLLLRLIERLFAPPIPAGSDILLHPVAYAAWGGMFVTMINLLPVTQLDGGHVAYALFGPRQDRFARQIHRAVLLFFFVSLGAYVVRDLRVGFGFVRLGRSIGNSMFWLMWFEVLAVLGALASRSLPHHEKEDGIGIRTRAFAMVSLIALAALGETYNRRGIWLAWVVVLGLLLALERRAGVLRPHGLLDHPPTGAAPLGAGRKAIALVSLAMFVLLFMPTPIEM